MELLRTDIISLHDLEFRGASLEAAEIERLRSASADTLLDTRLRESCNWLFDGQVLPGFERFSFPENESNKGSSLLLSSTEGIGVLSVWQSFPGNRDPLELKNEMWESSGPHLAPLANIGLEVEESDRYYPFIAVRSNASDLDDFCKNHAEEIGRLFTGGYDYEDSRYLKQYIENNISRRSYERLYIRWTEALAIYDRNVDTDNYENTVFRAVQLFETCIVIRRLLRTLNRSIDAIYPSVSLLRPRPWKVNSLSQKLMSLERGFVIAPPIWSAEAERLLQQAYEHFGIPKMFDSSKRSQEVLERRFQWAKTQLLVGLAVVTYILDKFKLFDLLSIH